MSSAARDAAIVELAKLVHGEWIESPQWSTERAAYEPRIAAVVDRLITAAAEEADARRAESGAVEAATEAARAIEQVVAAQLRLQDALLLLARGEADECMRVLTVEVARG